MHSINLTPPSATPLGSPWIEVGTSVNLTVPNYSTNNSQLSVYSSNEHVAMVSGSNTILGVGFGVATLTMRDTTQNNIRVASLTLYVGSVVILGADGNSWRIFPDGVCRQILPNDISQRMQNLETKKTLFADVGNNNIWDSTPAPTEPSNYPKPAQPDSTAVTCYLLNLQSVTRN